MKPKGSPHPSGRPIHERKIVHRSMWRVPEDGYVTPRLRISEPKDAIGFVHKFESGGITWVDPE